MIDHGRLGIKITRRHVPQGIEVRATLELHGMVIIPTEPAAKGDAWKALLPAEQKAIEALLRHAAVVALPVVKVDLSRVAQPGMTVLDGFGRKGRIVMRNAVEDFVRIAWANGEQTQHPMDEFLEHFEAQRWSLP